MKENNYITCEFQVCLVLGFTHRIRVTTSNEELQVDKLARTGT